MTFILYPLNRPEAMAGLYLQIKHDAHKLHEVKFDWTTEYLAEWVNRTDCYHFKFYNESAAP